LAAWADRDEVVVASATAPVTSRTAIEISQKVRARFPIAASVRRIQYRLQPRPIQTLANAPHTDLTLHYKDKIKATGRQIEFARSRRHEWRRDNR
jgi:hypothetical protein